MATRAEIDAKYGGGTLTKSPSGGSGPSAPVIQPSASALSARAAIDAKYGKTAAPLKKTETPVPPAASVPTEIISQAPKKNIFEKVSDSITNFFRGSPDERANRDAAVKAVSNLIADKNYTDLGRQLGIDQTVKVVLPKGIDPAKVDPVTFNFYKDQAIANEIKKNYSTYQKDFELPDQKDLEIDSNVIDQNLESFTKAIGVRTNPTPQEVAATLMSLPVVAGLVSNPITTVLGIAAFEGMTAVEKQMLGGKELYQVIGQNASPGVRDSLFLAELVGKGLILHGLYKAAPSVAEKFIHDTQIEYKLPQNVYIDAAKVKSIFQTGADISPEESAMVRGLGLTGAEYKAAIQNGVSIEIPAEKITTLVDKPWWGKLKSLIGLEPTSEVLKTNIGGEVKQGPRALLEAPKQDYFSKTPVERATTESPTPQKVAAVIKSPITTEILDTIKAFTPQESNAFGRKIVERINDEIGTKITEEKGKALPENIKLTEQEAPDGRPAQFNNQGKIEIFLPNLMKDLGTLSRGDEILAHTEIPEFSKVYKLSKGESLEDLSIRYVQDILLHEQAHADTMTLADNTRGRQLNDALIQAKASKNTAAINSAQKAVDDHMKELETRALKYEKENRTALLEKISRIKSTDVSKTTNLQRRINQNLKGGPVKRINISEKRLLKEGIKLEARGARAGFEAATEIGEKKIEAVKVGYEAAVETLKDKNATLQQRRFALVKYAEAFLPVQERGKFIRAINYPGSETHLEETLARMSKAADTVARKALMSEIGKELKGTAIKKKGGLPNVKFELESQRKLNIIRANIKGDYLGAQVEMSRLISEYQLAHPDDALPSDIIGQVQLLKMVGIQDMTAKELRGVLADIQSIKETGRTLREIDQFNRNTEIERARDQILEIITGGKPSPSATQSIKQDPEKKRFQGTREFLTLNQYGLEEILDVLSKLDKGSKPYQSFLSTYVGDRVNKAFNEQNKGELEQINPVNEKIKEIYKLKHNRDLLSEINEMKKIVDLGKITHADGIDRNLQISRGQAIQMIMWLEDPTIAPTFFDTLNWGEEVIDAINKFVTPEDRALATYLIDEFYPKYYETINPVFINEFGIDLPFNPKYSPVSRDLETTIPENVLLAQETHTYATARNNSLKNRVRNKIELKTRDALENLSSHITKMEHYKAWSESMQEFRKIFGNKEVRQSIVDFHGKRALSIMDNFLNDFARDGIDRAKVVQAVDKLRSNATKALLGLNWKVGFKQLNGVMNYAIELPLTDFLSGIGSFWTDPIGKAKFLYKNSGVLQERFGEGFERDIKFAIQKEYDKRLSKTKSLNELMFIIIRNADKLTVYHGSWAAYRSAFMEAKKLGKSDAEAKRLGILNAENITNRVQESSRLDTLSELQRQGSIAKLFTMFQSQQAKYLRIIMNASRNYRYGRGSRATNVKRILFAWFVIPMLYNAIANTLIADKYKLSGKGLLIETALGPLSMPLITGQMFQTIFGWVTGDKFPFTSSAVFSFMDDIQNGIKDLSTGDAAAALTYMIDSAGKIRGIPTTIITKPLRKGLKN